MPDQQEPDDQREPDEAELFDDERDALEIARLAYEGPRDDHARQEARRDHLLGHLATTRTVAGAMATLFAGAIVIAGEPLSPALAQTDVRIAAAITAALLAATLSISVVPYFWPEWDEPPSRDEFLLAEARMGYVALLWWLGDQTDRVVENNARSLKRLRRVVNAATVLATLSALALLLGGALAVLAVRQCACG